ncbi:Vegetative cell wall protein gp1 precursor (Hydroxyproline-rich glycoprotein 1) [Minicystis rosea]|nr:Vegetative cell wall protein gp1 precursor (Hydroxyproline-rich glycoprotein 1) [Minicystis rosea]
MADMTYAVHTRTCTYLLDDEGICVWTLSPGQAAQGTDRCVGAQFVACLDLSAPGGLVGELRLGASALFVHRENGKFVLLRTMPIEDVEYRARTEQEVEAHREVASSREAAVEKAAPQVPSTQATPPPPALPAPLPRAPAHADPTATFPLPQAAAAVPVSAAPLPSYAAAHADPTATYPLPAQTTTAHVDPTATYPLPGHAQPSGASWSDPAQAARAWAMATAERAAREPSEQRPPPPALELSYELPESDEPLDAEDLVSISVTEVTLTLPLYRATAPHAPPHPPPMRAPAPPMPAPRMPPGAYAVPAPTHAAPPAFALPPPKRTSTLPPPAPPPRPVSPPPVPVTNDADAGPPTPRGPPPVRRGIIGPGRRLR